MSYTIEQLFTRACSLVDSLKTDGTVDSSTTSDYRARTLTLVDMALKKLNVTADFYKIYEFSITDEDNDTWTKITLPSDVKSVTKVVIQTDDSYYIASDYQIEYEDTQQYMYIPFNIDGTVRVQYKANATVPTSFSDIIDIDDTNAIAICYDLAANFVATEQNEYLTSYFKSEFNEIKAEARRKQPQGEVSINSYYGLF